MKLEVKIKKILHTDSKTNYRIFKGQILNAEYDESELKHKGAMQKTMTFKGNMNYCSENDIYNIDAKFNTDKFGISLLIETSYLKKIELESELEAYMKNHIDGVGPKTSKLIIDKLGIGAIDKIKADDGLETLLNVLGPTKKNQANKIREHILYNANIFTIMEFLQINNLPVNMANKIIEEYGNAKLFDLTENPYLFIRCLKFKDLDGVASKKHHLDANNMYRLSAGVVALTAHNTSTKGDVYTHIDDIYENLESYINTYGAFEPIKLTAGKTKEAIEFALENGYLTCENNKFLYVPYLRNKENDVAYHIRRLNKQCRKASSKEILELIAEYEKEHKVKASDEQKEAIINTIQNGFSILTGLPGAGKTFTINLIIKIYLRLNPEARIKTIAPTGKASRRMTEMTGIEAQTVHKALNINQFTDKVDTLDHDLIIIDEASMLDIYIAGTLFGAIESGSKVLVVGDIEQLPSIGAGLILRDMIDSGVIPFVRLTKLFRQAEDSYIVTNAHAIAKETYDFKWDKNHGAIFWQDNTVEGIIQKVLVSYKRLLDTGYSRGSIGLLSPRSKDDALGAYAINKLIQANFNTAENVKSVVINDTGDILKEGDLVMQTENDYDTEIFNGEVGVVISVGDKKDENGNIVLTPDGKKDIAVLVDFSSEKETKKRLVTYDKKMCKHLDLAYCISIHKSQGSEYRAVISIIHDSHEMMLNKNLIYTAWTRAKEKLVVIGDEETLIRTSKKKDAVSRLSNLKEKLNQEKFEKTVYVEECKKTEKVRLIDIMNKELELSYNILGYDEDGDEIF